MEIRHYACFTACIDHSTKKIEVREMRFAPMDESERDRIRRFMLLDLDDLFAEGYELVSGARVTLS